mgnify:FL=1
MGYTTTNTKLMIGLGVSSISDSWTAFAQNEKELETYYQLINQNNLPIFKGHNLTQEDLIIRTHIRNIMCEFQTCWNDESLQFEAIYEVLESLHEMELDQLITIQNNTLKVTEAGKPFIRNICMAFDLRLKRTIPTTKIFSMTI